MTDTLAISRPARPAGLPARSPRATLAVVLAGQFMAVLDASVVNVAAPANALNPRTARAPKTGIRQAAIRHGIAFERKAAVFINTSRENRSGARSTAPMPIAPPQS